jgi:DNA-binding NtrC family response regulator
MAQDLKILVVDDERDIREGLKELLESEGYKVDTAVDGTDAIEKVRSLKYQIVITDIMMPKMSGIELLEKTKHISPFIEVIMITGYSTLERALECIEKGAISYIEKPFKEFDVIIERIKKAAGIIKDKREIMTAAMRKMKEKRE